MKQDDSTILPDVNQLIVERLQSYPDPVAAIALKAVQLSENMPEATVYEVLQGLVRESARATKRGGSDR